MRHPFASGAGKDAGTLVGEYGADKYTDRKCTAARRLRLYDTLTPARYRFRRGRDCHQAGCRRITARVRSQCEHHLSQDPYARSHEMTVNRS